MVDLSNKVYYDIIEEVCRSLIEEGDAYNIDSNMIYGLRDEWLRNLKQFQTETVILEEEPIESEKKSDLVFSESDSDFDGYDEIKNIEKGITNYMMCLFVKVTKSKNKWKCNFKQGFVNAENNDDLPFSGANGELEW